jgi:hypothetical protein
LSHLQTLAKPKLDKDSATADATSNAAVDASSPSKAALAMEAYRLKVR